MQKITLLGVLAILCLLAKAQQPALKPLTIGDTVPDIVFNHVTNYKTSTAKLSDFKSKLLILDFWSSWCGTCISLFPYMDSLQKEFGKDIQIILVNTKSKISKDDEPKIKKIIERVRNTTGSSLEIPVVYNSEELDSYFPCIGIPHEVWINGEGKVVGITYAEDVTRKNIKGILDGRNVQMRLKRDLFDFNRHIPLFINGNGGDGSQTKYRSIVTGYIDGVNGSSGFFREDDKTIGFRLINQSLFSITRSTYGNKIPFHNNRIIVEAKNKKTFDIKSSDSSYFQNVFCYELMVPPANDSIILEYARQDLKRYFNISVKNELRSIKCLVLTAPHGLKEMKKVEMGIDLEKSSLKKFIHNYPLNLAIDLLNDYVKTPLIDDTHLAKNISVDLPFDLNDVAKLKEAFKKIGLDLKEETKVIKVIVITDK